MTTTKKQKKSAVPYAALPVWDKACALVLTRTSPCGLYSGNLEPGVNYFVLMLEQLGAVTHYSCEGHPSNFYVLFEAPLKLVEHIKNCGYFTVELEGAGRWSIRMRKIKSDRERKQVLRWAAAAWEKNLGPCTVF